MTKTAGTVNPANMAFEDAWEIIGADMCELTVQQRVLRLNLLRRYRERRRPFTPAAVDAFMRASVRAMIEGASAKPEKK
jgi:hypothetical protein